MRYSLTQTTATENYVDLPIKKENSLLSQIDFRKRQNEHRF